jgi:hypothetical protein
MVALLAALLLSVAPPGDSLLRPRPVAGATSQRWVLRQDGTLSGLADSSSATGSVHPPARLRYLPGFGVMAGDWWGEPTGDMRRDDAGPGAV